MIDKEDDKKFLIKVGSNIKARRLELGWTLEQTEEKGYPSWRHLQKIEAGKNITLATLHRISKVLKTHPSKLV